MHDVKSKVSSRARIFTGIILAVISILLSFATTAYALSISTVPQGGTGLGALKAGYLPFGAGTAKFATSSSLFWNNTVGRLQVPYASTTALTVATNLTVAGASQLSTTTAAMLNGVINVTGWPYAKNDVGIQTAINACSALTLTTGCGGVSIAAGTSTINNSIIQKNGVDVFGQGDSTILWLANGVNKSVITTTNAASTTNFSIHDLKIDGNKANNSTGGVSGIRIIWGANFSIYRVHTTQTVDQGIEVTSGDDPPVFKLSHDFDIHDNVTEYSGRNGIYTGYTSHDFRLYNNTSKYNGSLAEGYGIMDGDYDTYNGIITNNYTAHNVLYGIGFGGHSKIIELNKTELNGDVGIRLASGTDAFGSFLATNIGIRHNTSIHDGGTGIRILGSVDGVDVSQNFIYYAGIHGISTESETIAGTLYNPTNITLFANFVSTSTEKGIIVNSDRTFVDSNTVNGSGSYGIYVDSAATNSTVKNNTGRGNTGALIHDAGSNTLYFGNYFDEVNTIYGSFQIALLSGAGSSIMVSDENSYGRVQTYNSKYLSFNPLGNNVGVGTTTPGTIFSIGNTGVGPINLSVTATSTFGYGINILNGCFAIGGNCLSHSNLTGVVPVASGGTNITSYTAGDLLYASAPTVLSRIASSTSGTVLALVNGVPTWVATTTLSTISGSLNLATQVTGALPIANGGTATTTFYSGGALFYDGTLNTVSQPKNGNGLFYDRTNNRVGIGTAVPGAQLDSYGVGATAGLGAAANYSAIFHFATGDNTGTAGPGIGFSTSNATTPDAITSAITALRTGGSGQGGMGFYTKSSTANGDAPVLAMTINQFQNILMGTSTGTKSPLVVGSSTAPQVALSDNLGNNLWTLRGIANSFFLATSTASATSTAAALSINPNGIPSFPAMGSGAVSAASGVLSAGTLSAANGGTGATGFGGTNTILYTTLANTLASNSNFTFDGTNAKITNGTWVFSSGGGGAEMTLSGGNSYGEIQCFNSKPCAINRQGNNVGIGGANFASQLSVNGNTSIGGTFSATAAPANGLIVQANTGIGTTTPGFLLDVYSTGTSSARIDSNSTTKGSCLIMKDSDGVGYTYVTANNGVLTASTIACN